MVRTLLVTLALLISTTLHAASGPIYKNVRVAGASVGVPEVVTDGYRHKLADSNRLGLNNVTPIQILSADASLAPITLSLGYRSGTSPETVTPLFGGNAVATNDTANGVMAGTGGTFVFIANTLSSSVRSDNTAKAIVLTAGNNLEQVAASKGLQSSGPARSLPSSLATYVDDETCDTTPSLLANDAIIMFELDSNDPTSAEYDFADLIVLVNFQTLVTSSDIGLAPLGTGEGYICGTTAQPYIRDSIGPDSSATDGTTAVANQYDSFLGLAGIVAFEVPAGTGGEVQTLDVVASSPNGSCAGGTGCFSGMSYSLVGWNNLTEAVLSPLVGTLFTIDIGLSLSVVPSFGTSGPSGYEYSTSLLSFDTSGLSAMCPQSGCVIGLLVDTSSSPVPDTFSIHFSNMTGPTDMQFCDSCGSGVSVATTGVRFSVVP